MVKCNQWLSIYARQFSCMANDVHKKYKQLTAPKDEKSVQEIVNGLQSSSDSKSSQAPFKDWNETVSEILSKNSRVESRRDNLSKASSIPQFMSHLSNSKLNVETQKAQL